VPKKEATQRNKKEPSPHLTGKRPGRRYQSGNLLSQQRRKGIEGNSGVLQSVLVGGRCVNGGYIVCGGVKPVFISCGGRHREGNPGRVLGASGGGWKRGVAKLDEWLNWVEEFKGRADGKTLKKDTKK